MTTAGLDERSMDALARVLADLRAELSEEGALELDAAIDALGLVDKRDAIHEVVRAAGLRADFQGGAAGLAYLRTVGSLLDVFPAPAFVAAARVRSRAVMSMVSNDLAAAREWLLAPLSATDLAPEVLGPTAARAIAGVLPKIAELTAYEYRATLMRLLRSEAVVQANLAEVTSVQIAVGFIDLVGYTRLSASVDPDGLRDVLKGFETLVSERVEAAEGVLVVKFIGDAAMLVSDRVDVLAGVLLDIVEAHGTPELDEAPRRAGLGYGAVMPREGDYFGTPVNLAARLTDLARPGSLLAHQDAVEAFGETWKTSLLPPVRLKGVGKSRPYRVRRPG